MAALERAGTPAVGFFSAGFKEDAERSAAIFGLPTMKLAITPNVFGNLSPDEVRAEADAVAETVIEALTVSSDDGVLPTASIASLIKPATTERFVGPEPLGAFDEMNQQFLDRGWSLGFPLVPPTRDKVELMLGGTTRKPQDVVAIMQPGLGVATVEKIAINAVMAGCSPEHLPVLITAVEALNSRGFPLRSLTQSTGGHGVVLMVNGPIAQKIGVNSGQAALVPGKPSRVNIALGHALRLTILNLGHAYPGIMDMSTIGSPRKYGMVFAENEANSPWPAFHVERGFASTASTVTVFGCRADMDVGDTKNYTGERILTTYCGFANGSVVRFLGWKHQIDPELSNHSPNMFILMSPDHANTLAKDGWSKEGIRTFLFERARIPARTFRNFYKDVPEAVAPEWRWVLSASDEQLIPCVESAANIHLSVVGGPLGRSLLMFHYGLPVTREMSS